MGKRQGKGEKVLIRNVSPIYSNALYTHSFPVCNQMVMLIQFFTAKIQACNTRLRIERRASSAGASEIRLCQLKTWGCEPGLACLECLSY